MHMLSCKAPAYGADAGSCISGNSHYMQQPKDASLGCLYGNFILQHRSGSSPEAWMLVMADPLPALPCGSCQQAAHAHWQQHLCRVSGAAAGWAGHAAAGRQQRECGPLHALLATFASHASADGQPLPAAAGRHQCRGVLPVAGSMQTLKHIMPKQRLCGSMHHVLRHVWVMKGVKTRSFLG